MTTHKVSIAGVEVVVGARDLLKEDFDECMDENFFNEDYDTAASTGFFIWEGCWILIDLCKGEFGKTLKGKRVLELGSGTGLAGLCAAVCGAHVLMTDVATVVDGMLIPNTAMNANLKAPEEKQEIPDINASVPTTNLPWPCSTKIGSGTATSLTLNWRIPVKDQLTETINPFDADIILAAECIWLKELIDPFVETVFDLLQGKNKPRAIICFRDRAIDTSQVFVHMAEVIAQFENKNCKILKLSEKAVRKEDAKKSASNPNSPVVVYEVTLRL